MSQKMFVIMSVCLACLLSACEGLEVFGVRIDGDQPTRQSPGVLVDYRRSGGFAGLDDHLIINTDGSASLTRKNTQGELALTGTELNSLAALFKAARFTELNPQSLPPKGADLISYTITYQGHTVRTADTAVPDELQPVLQALNQLIDSSVLP